MKTQEHFRGRIIRRFMDDNEFVEFQKKYDHYKIPKLGRELVDTVEKARTKFDF